MGSTTYKKYKDIIDNNTKNAKVIDGLLAQRFISFKKDLLATGLDEKCINPLVEEAKSRLFSICGNTPELAKEFEMAVPDPKMPTLMQSCKEALEFADQESTNIALKVDHLVEVSMKLYMMAQLVVDYHFCDNHALSTVNALKDEMLKIQEKINSLTKTPAA